MTAILVAPRRKVFGRAPKPLHFFQAALHVSFSSLQFYDERKTDFQLDQVRNRLQNLARIELPLQASWDREFEARVL
ncbi:MAG: hypothetical protein Q9175_002330 [Cornicularia normoerica]